MDSFSLSFFRLICPFHDRSSPGTFYPEYKKVYLKQIVNVKITKNSFITRFRCFDCSSNIDLLIYYLPV